MSLVIESFIESIQDIMTIPAAFPTVMYLFTLPHSPTTWSICLQANDDPQNTDLLLMVLREYDETSESWITGDSVPVKTCTQLEIKDIDGAVFIFLLTKDFNEEPQMNMDEPNGNNIFLGILSGDNHDRSFCSLHIYQWDYSSFALFDLIPMHCATTIKSFLLNSSVFLAVCHRWNESDKLGAGNHTTLFKFNEELQSFEVHQLLSMSNCSNIEYFEYASSDFSKPEQFLVITGLHGDQENSPISRIYKLHDEYFYPFQTISLDYVQQWMMYGSAGESILLAATRYSGIHLFEYDGLLADRSNDGTHPNVFQIRLISADILKSIAETYDEWHSEMTRDLKTVADQLKHLQELLRSAPRVDSSEIPEGESLNDTREKEFAEELESELTELKIIETFVNKLVNGGGKFIVDGDLFLDQFELNCIEECDLNILSITNLNGEDFDTLIDNTVNIDSPGSYNALNFENIAVSLNLNTVSINGHTATSLVHQGRDNLFRNGLRLDSIAISDKLSVQGTINGIKMDSHSVLLVSGDQTLNGSLIFKEGTAETLYCVQNLRNNSNISDCCGRN
ncbi:unnamed protein product [Bemisia tabaci]|uniref:Uncharacterized protein n=1 Tax=Bemisia tabaci TaxID=7038 RepID=A0A9P0EXF2_BEMTA|nr:unnamed protein product [Bemisia tabaci]